MQFAKHTKQAKQPSQEHPQLALEEAVILGHNVERLRKLQSLSITTFAQMAGISRPTLYKIENGTSYLKLSMIARIAKALDTTVSELLSLPDPSKNAPRDSYIKSLRGTNN